MDLQGTDGSDVLTGTAVNDTIDGLAGDDVISGRAGRDVLLGGAGSDFIQGGSGRDSVNGGDGDDDLRGGYGPDEIEADGGDRAFGGGQRDFLRTWCASSLVRLHGGGGDDVLSASVSPSDGLSPAPTRLHGDAGDDVVSSSHERSLVWGGFGADRIVSAAADTIRGGSGDDSIELYVVCCHEDVTDLAGTARRILGGSGDDTIQTAYGTIDEPLSCGPGEDTVLMSPGQPWASDCETHWNYFFSFALGDGCGFDHFVGTNGNDWFEADSDGAIVEARGGNDHIDFFGTASAGSGDDYIDASSSDGTPDRIRCGPGLDTVVLNQIDIYAPDCEVVTMVP